MVGLVELGLDDVHYPPCSGLANPLAAEGLAGDGERSGRAILVGHGVGAIARDLNIRSGNAWADRLQLLVDAVRESHDGICHDRSRTADRDAVDWLLLWHPLRATAVRGGAPQPSICESACNKDPVFGVIGIETGPRHQGMTLASIVFGSRGLDVGRGDNCKDSTSVFQAG
jgi:hypothetical protein